MIISKKISESMISELCHSKRIDAKYADAYQYTLEQLFDILIFHTSLLFIGMLLRCLPATCIYILVITPTKMLAGGAHAGSRGMCSLISYSVYFFVIIICPSVPVPSSVACVLLIPIVFMIVFLTPVDHPNKMFLPHQRSKMKCFILIYLSVLTIIGVGLAITDRTVPLRTVFFSLFIVLINQLIGKVLYRSVSFRK